jgi:hypothetical protein
MDGLEAVFSAVSVPFSAHETLDTAMRSGVFYAVHAEQL